MTDQPQETPEAPAPVEADEATGVGVYDDTLQRFVGGVFRGSSSSKDAQAFIRGRKDDGHEYSAHKV